MIYKDVEMQFELIRGKITDVDGLKNTQNYFNTLKKYI